MKLVISVWNMLKKLCDDITPSMSPFFHWSYILFNSTLQLIQQIGIVLLCFFEEFRSFAYLKSLEDVLWGIE